MKKSEKISARVSSCFFFIFFHCFFHATRSREFIKFFHHFSSASASVLAIYGGNNLSVA